MSHVAQVSLYKLHANASTHSLLLRSACLFGNFLVSPVIGLQLASARRLGVSLILGPHFFRVQSFSLPVERLS